MQLTRTLGIWLDTLHHTMNTIWYDNIFILYPKVHNFDVFMRIPFLSESLIFEAGYLFQKLVSQSQVAYLANMTSSPGSKAAQHFATFMGKLVSLFHKLSNFLSTIFLSVVLVLPLVPMATQCPSPMRASPCSLTTTTTTS